MKIEELLTKITPLPWSTPHFAIPQSYWDKMNEKWEKEGMRNSRSRCDCGYILCDSLMGAIATVHKGDEKNEGDDPVKEVADANAIYLAHAANNFGETLAALRAVIFRYREWYPSQSQQSTDLETVIQEAEKTCAKVSEAMTEYQ